MPRVRGQIRAGLPLLVLAFVVGCSSESQDGLQLTGSSEPLPAAQGAPAALTAGTRASYIASVQQNAGPQYDFESSPGRGSRCGTGRPGTAPARRP